MDDRNSRRCFNGGRRFAFPLWSLCSLWSLCFLLSLSAEAWAQPYPSKPIRFVVPYPPGGPLDAVARLLGQKISESVRQPVIVDNKPGAGGNIGADVVAKAPPDGYTILMGAVATHAINPTLYPGIPYDAVRDFVPRAMDKRIDLGYEGPEREPPAPKLRGQPMLVLELIRNLVDNALQYTPAGGTVTVRVVDDPFGQVVVLQVEDSGPGIPEAERELVFQPFYRALGTNVDGSGLGLPIVLEIARQHNASITLEDAHAGQVPPGTRVTVRFVIGDAAAA